jgi:hypothetical protein
MGHSKAIINPILIQGNQENPEILWGKDLNTHCRTRNNESFVSGDQSGSNCEPYKARYVVDI